MEGQVQAGKQGPVAEGVILGILLGAGLLKRHIGDRQPGAGGHGAVVVRAGGHRAGIAGFVVQDRIPPWLGSEKPRGSSSPFYVPSVRPVPGGEEEGEREETEYGELERRNGETDGKTGGKAEKYFSYAAAAGHSL